MKKYEKSYNSQWWLIAMLEEGSRVFYVGIDSETANDWLKKYKLENVQIEEVIDGTKENTPVYGVWFNP